MFCKRDEIKIKTRDRVLTDQEYQTPVDAHQNRFQTRLALVLLALAAVGLTLAILD